MKVVVVPPTKLEFTVDVSTNGDLQSFKTLCYLVCGISKRSKLVMMLGDRNLDDDLSVKLKEVGFKDGDYVHLVKAGKPENSAAVPGSASKSSKEVGALKIGKEKVVDSDVPSTVTVMNMKRKLRSGNDNEKIFCIMPSAPDAARVKVEDLGPKATSNTSACDSDDDDLDDSQSSESEDEKPVNCSPTGSIPEVKREALLSSISETERDESHLIYALCKMGNADCRVGALIDTCSTLTMMSRMCAVKCGVVDNINPSHQDRYVRNGETIRFAGRLMNERILMGIEVVRADVYVATNLREDMIIGMDVLQGNDCKIGMSHTSYNFLTMGISGCTIKLHSSAKEAEEYDGPPILPAVRGNGNNQLRSVEQR